MVLLTVAWRNIWRNKLRSLIIIASIAIGVFAGIFISAFMKGMTSQRIESAIKTELSYIQIHNPAFRETEDIDLLIDNAQEKCQKIKQIVHVNGLSPRIIIKGMAASAGTSSGVQMLGIDPKEEHHVTNIDQKLISGKFLEGAKRNPVVIGAKLAKTLNLKLKSKVIFTFLDYQGELTGGAFRVAGIFQTANSMFDESTVFVRKTDMQKLTNIPPNTVHEIVVNINDNQAGKLVKSKIVELYPGTETMLWTELQPELAYITQISDIYMYIFVGIILFTLGFGIVNTMLMVVLERIKEIGMLLAIGMNKLRVFNMIVLETVFLSITGGLVGIILGGIVSKYFSVHPIDLALWADSLSSMGWDSLVYTRISFSMLIQVAGMLVLTGILAAVYPARKALKLNPADSLRIE